MDQMGWSPGGVKYRAAYAANNISNINNMKWITAFARVDTKHELTQ